MLSKNNRQVGIRVRNDRHYGRAAAGFTLVELIMTLIVVGILAVAVLPRFADKSLFEARGFRDENLSLLRYAQKSAVAQRRTVCVDVKADGTGFDLRIDTAAVPDGVCDGVRSLTLPVTPRGSSGLAPYSLKFLASGCATQATECGTGELNPTADIKVVAATGYIYAH